jgi:1,2-diacylglycerol 3-alpha-glucosyltransferase
MHVVILFTNIGSYHAARLRAAAAACGREGWRMTALQVTDHTLDHPWGDLSSALAFPLVTVVPWEGEGRPELAPGEVARGVRAALDTLRADAVFVPGWATPAARAAAEWCRNRGAAAILMSESKADDAPRRWWMERAKGWFVRRRFDAALVGGALHREYLESLGMPPERIFRGYNAVDNDYFAAGAARARRDPAAARSRHPAMPPRPFLQVVTRFVARKNVLGLLDEYARYRAKVPADRVLDLALCGEGEERPLIERRIEELSLGGCVHLPGFLPLEALPDWYGLATALVHTALVEQWGLVVNEACAAGLPVVCSRTVGAAHELVVEGENGFRFDPAVAGDLARALGRLTELGEGERLRMGEASVRLVERFSPARFGIGVVAAVRAARPRA